MVTTAARPVPTELAETEAELVDDPEWPDACGWPRNILEAYNRWRGPYTVQNVAFLLEEEPLELYNGWLVWQAMTDPPERRVAANIQVILDLVARAAGFGQAYPDQLECVMGNGDTVKPDLCLISNQLFERKVRPVKKPDKEGKHLKLHGSPELVVEIHSPSNTRAEERKKRDNYFASGARVIWDVDPRREIIRVFEPDNQEQGIEYIGEAEISCSLFPNWKRQAADFFSKDLSVEQIVGQEAVKWRNESHAEGEAVGRAEGEAVGRAEGEAVGRRKATQEMLLRQARRRFAVEQLPADLEAQLELLSVEQLAELADAVATSHDLDEWLESFPT